MSKNDDFQIDGVSMGDDEPKAREQREQRSKRTPDETGDEKAPPRGLRLGMAGNRATVGGVSDAALNTIAEMFENGGTDTIGNLTYPLSAFKLLKLPKSRAIAYPTAVLVLTVGNVDLYYALIMDQPGNAMTRPQEDVGNSGRSYESLVLAEDMLTAPQRFEDELGRLVKAPLQAGYQTVPSSQTVVLAEGMTEAAKAVSAALLNNALDALSGTAEKLEATAKGEIGTGASLTPDSAINGTMVVTTEDVITTVEDSSGAVVRADAINRISFKERSKDDDNGDTFHQFPLAETAVAVDLWLTEDDYNSYSRHSRELRPFWKATLNATGFIRKEDTPMSLELILYQLMTLAPLTQDRSWCTLLRPKTRLKGAAGVVSPLVDLGWLQYYSPDENDARKVEIPDAISDMELADYLHGTVDEAITVTMTVNNAGQNTWAMLPLVEAACAATVEERTNNITTIYEAMQVLTGDRFSDLMERSDLSDYVKHPPVYNPGYLELVGTFVDDDGNTRALSEITVPAFATLMGDKPGAEDLVFEYQLTFETEQSGYGVDYNLSARKELLERVLRDVKVTGTAQPLVINPLFLEIGNEALEDTKLAPDVNGNLRMERTRRPGSLDFASSATTGIKSARRKRDRGNADRGRGRRVRGGRR